MSIYSNLTNLKQNLINDLDCSIIQYEEEIDYYETILSSESAFDKWVENFNNVSNFHVNAKNFIKNTLNTLQMYLSVIKNDRNNIEYSDEMEMLSISNRLKSFNDSMGIDLTPFVIYTE